MAPCFDDAVTPVEIDKIYGELHTEGVHSFAWHYPQAFTANQSDPAQQTFSAALATVCQLDAISNFDLASDIRYTQSNRDSLLALWQ